MSIKQDPNVQFNALCKVLYQFGGVCTTIQEKYIADDLKYDYYVGTGDDEPEMAKNALPDLAMPLSIKPSNIGEFVWDGSLIEAKLYEAIQLPKPRPRGARGKGSKDRQSRPKKDREHHHHHHHHHHQSHHKTKDMKNKPSIKAKGGDDKKGIDVVATPVVEEKKDDNVTADVMAIFGGMFNNGTKPDKRSENVEDVLSSLPVNNPTNNDQNKQQKAKEAPKNDFLIDLFGPDDFKKSDTTKNGKNKNDEPEEKQKEKIKAQAAREIKKLINSFPDLSFLRNIKVT